MSTSPVGVFDSGLGGLSVIQEIQKRRPDLSLIYVADTARVPYGSRSPQEIRRFSLEIMGYLAEQGVESILSACNTSSAVILPEYCSFKGIPVMGLLQAGAMVPPNFQDLVILATEATTRSKQYTRQIQQRWPWIRCRELACPEFVPLVENGQWQTAEAGKKVRQRLAPLLENLPEAVILGCSHYPYLAPWIQDVLGPEVKLLNPAENLASALNFHLGPPHAKAQGSLQVCVTGDALAFQKLAAQYLETPLHRVYQIQLESQAIKNIFALPAWA